MMTSRKFLLIITLVVTLAFIMVSVTSAGTLARAQAFQACMVDGPPTLLTVSRADRAPWVGKVTMMWMYSSQIMLESSTMRSDSSGYTGSVSPMIRQSALLVAGCLRSTFP